MAFYAIKGFKCEILSLLYEQSSGEIAWYQNIYPWNSVLVLVWSSLTIVSDTVCIAIIRQSTGLVTRLYRRGEELIGLSSKIARFGCCPVPPSVCDMSSILASGPWLGGGGPWYGGVNVFVFTSPPSWWGGAMLGTYFGFLCRGNYWVIWVRRFWRLSRLALCHLE